MFINDESSGASLVETVDEGSGGSSMIVMFGADSNSSYSLNHHT